MEEHMVVDINRGKRGNTRVCCARRADASIDFEEEAWILIALIGCPENSLASMPLKPSVMDAGAPQLELSAELTESEGEKSVMGNLSCGLGKKILKWLRRFTVKKKSSSCRWLRSQPEPEAGREALLGVAKNMTKHGS